MKIMLIWLYVAIWWIEATFINTIVINMISLSTSGLLVCQYTCSHQNIVTAASLSKFLTSKSVVQALHSQKVRENWINGMCVCAFTKIYIKNPENLLVLPYKYSHHMKITWIVYCMILHIRLVHMFSTQRITREVYWCFQHMTI